MTDTLPRTLIVGPNVLNMKFGGGVTLSRLFGGWPTDRLAQVHADTLAPDDDVCERYYQLNRAVRPAPASMILRHGKWLAEFALGHAEYALIWPRITKELARWLDDFRPQLIFAQPASLALLRLSELIVARHHIPLAVHVSDDWAFDWPASRLGRRIPPFTSWLSQLTRREFREFVRGAAARLCISDAMSRALEQRCGVPFETFHNVVDPAEWPERRAMPMSNGRPFRLLYSGSLYPYTQLESLIDIARAVVSINDSRITEPKVTLEICTHPSYESHRQRLEARPFVSFTTAVPMDQLPAKLAAADALVLPVNFDRHSLDFVRHSLPGKLTEYLMSARPILAYGPREAAPIAYAIREKFAAVVADRDRDTLVRTINELATSAGRRDELSRAARRLGEREHSLASTRARFRQTLRSAAALG